MPATAVTLLLAALLPLPQVALDPEADERNPPVIPGEGVAVPGLAGVTFDALLEVEASRNVSGGIEQSGVLQRKLSLGLSADLDAAFGWEGARAYAEGLTAGGGSLTDRVGDLQIVSEIESDRRDQLSELWFEQRFGELWRVQLGKSDANNEFARVATGDPFMNSSFGFSPTIFPLPSYPDSAYGAIVEWSPHPQGSVKIGAYDGATANGSNTGTHSPGVDDDIMYASELALTWGDGEGSGTGRFAVGAWRHTADFARWSGGSASHADGAWMVLEQTLWSRDEGESVAAFAQAGWTDDELTTMGGHLGGGVVWWNALPGHSPGVGFTRVELTDEPAAGLKYDHETAIETFWHWQATDRLVLQPTVQGVIHPGGTEDDALVVSARLSWTL